MVWDNKLLNGILWKIYMDDSGNLRKLEIFHKIYRIQNL